MQSPDRETFGHVYYFNAGVEHESRWFAAEASGRSNASQKKRLPPKALRSLRNDLCLLPALLSCTAQRSKCANQDTVLVPQLPSGTFLSALEGLFGCSLPRFVSLDDSSAIDALGVTAELTECLNGTSNDRHEQSSSQFRPFAWPGPHLRRSRIEALHSNVAVCRSLEEVDAAVTYFQGGHSTASPPLAVAGDSHLRLGADAVGKSCRVVLKAEYSCSGQGVRWGWDDRPGSREWCSKHLLLDGVVVVEPVVEIILELCGVFWEGEFLGFAEPIVEGGVWRGHRLGPIGETWSQELRDYVLGPDRGSGNIDEVAPAEKITSGGGGGATQRRPDSGNTPTVPHPGRRRLGRAEEAMRALGPRLPRTCGVDCAVVRGDGAAGLELRLFELNARTNMAHFALAAARLVPGALRFEVVRVSDLTALGASAVPLTDPASASMWCAVVVVGGPGIGFPN